MLEQLKRLGIFKQKQAWQHGWFAQHSSAMVAL